MYKYLLIGLAIVVTSFVANNQNWELQNDTAKDLIIVGTNSGYPPFEYLNASGQIVGFDIDIANLIAQKLNKKLIIKDMEFDSEILALQQGKIDLIISGMNITPSRQKEIAMIPYHGDAAHSLSLIFWNEIPEGMHSLSDISRFPGAVITVASGTIAEEYINKFKSIHTKSFDGSLACLMDVKFGKSIANLAETDVAAYLQQQHPEIKILTVAMNEEEHIDGFGIGINKNNPKLSDQVSAIIQELKTTDLLKQLEDKWFKGEQPHEQ